MARMLWLFAVVSVAWLHAPALLAAPASQAGERPNVVLILTDNQSYFELSCKGHKQVRTPRIDALAASSVDFANFHAPPYCSPSRGVLMTGRYAMRYGIHTTIAGRSILHRSELTLADRLLKAGYRTGVFGKWHLGFSYPYMPRHRGFDETFVHGGGGIGQMEDYFGNNHIDASYWRNGKPEKSSGFSTDVLFSEGLKFIEAHKDRPFFCFISTPATHSPWQAHPGAAVSLKKRGVTGNALALYSMIENIDTNVGRVVDKLDQLKLSRKTILVFATDQGMTDRGAPMPTGRGNRKSDRDGFDERHHVFCMVRYPPLTKAHRSTAIAGMVDMAPTILDLTGIGKVADQDGRSLRPLLGGAKRWEDDRVLIIQCPRGRDRKKWRNAAVKTQRWRFVGGDRLYDVEADPGLQKNVAADHPEVVKRLTAKYEAFWGSLPSEAENLSRHVIGPNPTRLNAMDWYKGASPWHKGAFRGRANGAWAVEVEKAGRYRFELRHYPREAGKPTVAKTARVRLGETEVDARIANGAAVAELDLKPGRFDLATTLTGGDRKGKGPWGALFVYVSRVGD